MIAWRGASRYMDDKFRPAFEMELDAMKSVKTSSGWTISSMVPFCRTPEEGRIVTELLNEKESASYGD